MRTRSIILQMLLVELLVLAGTGIALFFVYRPTSSQSWPGLVATNEGWDIRIANSVRLVHVLAAWLLFFTAVAAAVASALPARRRWQAVMGLGILVGGVVTGMTGLLLPWDQLALRAVKVGTHFEGYTFLFQSSVRFVLVGGAEVTPRTLAVWLVVHGLLLGPALTALVVLAWRRRPVTHGQQAANRVHGGS